MIYGNTVGGSGGGTANAYILVDDSGKEYAAVLMDEETVLDATENDIRAGKYAATDNGVVLGSKEIPSYHTIEGYKLITVGSPFSLLVQSEGYDFTKFQAIICPFSGSIDGSVAAEKIAINEGVYAVNSVEQLATVTKDGDTRSINLGITNESESPYLLRYFTYKEIV